MILGSEIQSSLLLTAPPTVPLCVPVVRRLGWSDPPPHCEVPAGAQYLLVVGVPGNVPHAALVSRQNLYINIISCAFQISPYGISPWQFPQSGGRRWRPCRQRIPCIWGSGRWSGGERSGTWSESGGWYVRCSSSRCCPPPLWSCSGPHSWAPAATCSPTSGHQPPSCSSPRRTGWRTSWCPRA